MPPRRVSEEMTVEGIRDEITWSPYANLDNHLGYFISVDKVLEDIFSVIHLAPVTRYLTKTRLMTWCWFHKRIFVNAT